MNGVTVVNGGVLAAGTYTVTGAGGKDVGPFKPHHSVAAAGGHQHGPRHDSTSQDLTLSWNGGGTDAVTITGSSSVELWDRRRPTRWSTSAFSHAHYRR